MSAILHSLNVHNLHIFHPILMILVSKSMVHRALSEKTYLLLGLLSPLSNLQQERHRSCYISGLPITISTCNCFVNKITLARKCNTHR